MKREKPSTDMSTGLKYFPNRGNHPRFNRLSMRCPKWLRRMPISPNMIRQSGIPSNAKKMQNTFPPDVWGEICPYPKTKYVFRQGNKVTSFSAINKCSVGNYEIKKAGEIVDPLGTRLLAYVRRASVRPFDVTHTSRLRHVLHFTEWVNARWKLKQKVSTHLHYIVVIIHERAMFRKDVKSYHTIWISIINGITYTISHMY